MGSYTQKISVLNLASLPFDSDRTFDGRTLSTVPPLSHHLSKLLLTFLPSRQCHLWDSFGSIVSNRRYNARRWSSSLVVGLLDFDGPGFLCVNEDSEVLGHVGSVSQKVSKRAKSSEDRFSGMGGLGPGGVHLTDVVSFVWLLISSSRTKDNSGGGKRKCCMK